MNIGFIGIGKLGLPCAEEMAKRGHDVFGYDIEPRSSQYVSITKSIEECVTDKNIVFVAVPTPHDELYDGRYPTSHLTSKDFDYEIVKQCLQEANKFMNKEQLLVLISTVLPGTVRKEFINLVDNTRFIYNPYLIAMGSVSWDMVNPEMVIIGTKDGSMTGDASQLISFYRTIMDNDPRYEIGTYDECECIKIFYNTFISTKIALVNMIQDVAVKQGNINVDIVTNALAKSTKRITGPQYMTAGLGDGGACHPRDNIALRYLAHNLDLGYDLFDAIMSAREIQAKNLAKLLVQQSLENNLPIFIHGKAYKPNVPYLDGSYSILVGHYCEQLGSKVQYIDPLTEPKTPRFIKGIILLAHNASVTYKYTEHLRHKEVLYCKFEEGSVIIDPWRSYKNEELKVIHYGNTRNV